jgi:uncharacterized protein (AIM24 family)
MNRALKMIDEVLQTGSLTEKEHDRIMELIHKDGVIDEEESIKLSQLFSSIKSGSVVLNSRNSNSGKNENLSSLKEEALKRDFEREIYPQPVTSNTPLEAPNKTLHNDLEKRKHEIAELPLEQGASEPGLDSDFQHLFGLKEYPITPREEIFHKVSDRMLEAQLNGRIWMKTGAMIAYQGAMKFRREGITEHGLGKLLKRGMTGESTPLTAAEGKGALFLADQGKKICIVKLKGVPIYVQSQHILAFEDAVNWDVQPLFNIGTALAGGLFHICFSGRGKIAFTSEFDPVVLRVKPGAGIMTDAAATVGWSSGVVPSVRTDINIQTLIGRGSGETLQLRFEGDGVVIVQPFETRISPEK